MITRTAWVRWLEDVGMEDVPLVGGKNASLGELTKSLREAGVRVPGGFAVTAEAYKEFVALNGLRPAMEKILAEWEAGRRTLPEAGKALRGLFTSAKLPPEVAAAVREAYGELSRRSGRRHETFLNVRGEAALLDAVRRCFASLFTDRAISYRKAKGFDHMKVFLSVGVQVMVRSDRGGSGVMFTLDTDTGFPRVAVVNAVWGLGETIVQGLSTPDEYVVFKPLLDKAAGIVTDAGGRTSHAAIVSRELGLPAVVGTGKGTAVLKEGRKVTLSCAEGPRGFVYPGEVPYEVDEEDPSALPRPAMKILLNIASPEAAFRWWRLPVQGVGLARMEFIISDAIKVHPMALAAFDRVKDAKARRAIAMLTKGYKDRGEYFVEKLAEGIAPIAAAHHPNPVIVRLSDFKTNEYAGLIGGRDFEPVEENPMLGFRGASRYYDERYKAGFALECRALKRVREDMGLDNVVVMVPFCRTLTEADRVLAVMAENGLRRGEKGLQVYVMCEIPSNVILAEEFADRFDGFSIGSNDLTQLTLGVDRDSGILAKAFDERDEAVKRLIRQVIEAAHRKGRPVGICGQAPSDHPDFAEFLVAAGIDSISLNPDSVVPVIKRLTEKKLGNARPTPRR